jgi:hypothetical protein
MKTAFAIFFGLTMAAQAQEATPEIRSEIRKVSPDGAVNATFQTFEFVGGQLLNGAPVKGAPYSAEAVRQTTQTLADGSHIVNQSSSMLYRDSEGRERREESIGRLGPWSAEGAPVKTIFISDPVAKVSYTLDPGSHTAQKMPAALSEAVSAGGGPGVTLRTMIADGPGPLPPPPSGSQVLFFSRVNGEGVVTSEAGKSAAKTEKLGISTVEGVQAEGTRTTVTIPAGQIGNERDINIVSERWYSPELKVTIMSRHSDPRMGETVYKLTNLNRAEPLHSMFEVPTDYTISDSSAIRVRKGPVKQDEQ